MSNLVSLDKLACIKIQGAQATTFLQGQLTCDVNALKASHALPGAHCDHKGRMQCNFWIWRSGEDFYLLLPRSMLEVAAAGLRKYAVFSKVSVTPIEDSIYGVLNDESSRESEARSNPDLRHCESEARSNPEYINLPDKRVFFLSTEQLSTNTNSNAWDLADIQLGFCFLQPNTSNLFTPQMLNLEKLNGVSFSKGCYIGQEIIARTEYLGKAKRHLYRAEISMPAEIGTEIHNENKEIAGIVVTCVPQNNAYTILTVLEDRSSETVLQIATTQDKLDNVTSI